MKILILGSRGMVGHTIYDYLKSLNKYEIVTMARTNADYNFDIIENPQNILDIIKDNQYDIIINCIGLLVKASENCPAEAIYVNGYFSHLLEEITKNTNTKVVHLSTNCVFKEDRGSYLDTDIPDGDSWYSKSKALGELNNKKDLTVRMSIIGTELKGGTGLLEWTLRQKGIVKGFKNCFWNGITTYCLAQNIDKMIESNVVGLYQLAPNYKIDKYNLLKFIQLIWDKKDIDIVPNEEIKKDSTLINSYRDNFQPIFPESYLKMLLELKIFTKKRNE